MSFAHNTPVQFVPGIGRRTAQVLHDLGIHTAGQFNNMPTRVLVELFGPSIKAVINTINIPVQRSTRNNLGSSTKKEMVKPTFMRRIRLAAQLVSVL